MPFTFEHTNVEGVVLIDPKIFPDERGFFMESYKRSDFEAIAIKFQMSWNIHDCRTKARVLIMVSGLVIA